MWEEEQAADKRFEISQLMKKKVICYQLEFGKKFVNVLTKCSSCHQDGSEGKVFSKLKLEASSFTQ